MPTREKLSGELGMDSLVWRPSNKPKTDKCPFAKPSQATFENVKLQNIAGHLCCPQLMPKTFDVYFSFELISHTRYAMSLCKQNSFIDTTHYNISCFRESSRMSANQQNQTDKYKK